MAFGSAGVPEGHEIRSYRVKVMSTRAKHRRATAMLVAGGDAWSFCIDRFHARIRAGLPNANSLIQLWPDQKAHGPFGDLSAHCAQDITKAWSSAYFEAIRRKLGLRAALPLKKHHLVPVTWRKGEFTLVPSTGRTRARVELATRRRTEKLVLALSHDHPYDCELVRCVRLVSQAGELFLDLTAWVALSPVELTSGPVAGVDPGIIHPLALSCGSKALLISGRASRAEEFLHLEDSKARAKKASTRRAPLRARPGSPRQAGSRAWRKLHARQQVAELRSRRVVTLAANRAARLAASFLEQATASRVVIGDPTGVRDKHAGAVQNRRTHRWLVVHTTKALCYRLEEAGIAAELTDERGTSSHCPDCGAVATKRGRILVCTDPVCNTVHHRDVAGAQNMVRKLGRAPSVIAHIEHRRVGTPARRDQRRVSYELLSRTPPEVSARTRATTVASAGVESLVTK
jgi:IS605 OrfB family transposase